MRSTTATNNALPDTEYLQIPMYVIYLIARGMDRDPGLSAGEAVIDYIGCRCSFNAKAFIIIIVM